MRKIYAIAAFLLLGAAAMQAQPVAHQAGVAKGNEFKAEMMEPENAGDAVVATEAERAAMSLKAAPAITIVPLALSLWVLQLLLPIRSLLLTLL